MGFPEPNYFIEFGTCINTDNIDLAGIHLELLIKSRHLVEKHRLLGTGENVIHTIYMVNLIPASRCVKLNLIHPTVFDESDVWERHTTLFRDVQTIQGVIAFSPFPPSRASEFTIVSFTVRHFVYYYVRNVMSLVRLGSHANHTPITLLLLQLEK